MNHFQNPASLVQMVPATFAGSASTICSSTFCQATQLWHAVFTSAVHLASTHELTGPIPTAAPPGCPATAVVVPLPSRAAALQARVCSAVVCLKPHSVPDHQVQCAAKRCSFCILCLGIQCSVRLRAALCAQASSTKDHSKLHSLPEHAVQRNAPSCHNHTSTPTSPEH